MKKTLLLCITLLPGLLYAQTWVSYSSSNSQIPFDKVHCIATGAGTIWVGNNVSGPGNHIAGLTNSTWISGLPNAWVDDLSVDSAGNLWTVSSGNLKKWNGSVWTDYSSSLIGYWSFPIHADMNGNVWMVNQASKKLVKFDGNAFSEITLAQGLPSTSINEITDFRGDVAFAFADAGVAVYDGSAFTTYTAGNSALPGNKVSDIAAAGDSLWMVLEGGVVSCLWNGSITNFQDTSLNTTAALIATGQDGKVWIGTKGDGLAMYDGVSVTRFTYPAIPILDTTNIILSLATIGNTVCIGTRYNGLVLYGDFGSTSIPVPLSESASMHIYPLPASDHLMIRSQGFGTTWEASVHTLTGECVRSHRGGGDGEERIDLGGLASGTYFIQLRGRDASAARVIIINQ